MKRIKITSEQYKRLVEGMSNDGPLTRGGINRVDKEFTKKTKGTDIQTFKPKDMPDSEDIHEYDDFNIKAPLTPQPGLVTVPNTRMKKRQEFNPVNEDIFNPELHEAIRSFIENIWMNPSQKGLDRFFVQNGITWGDIISYLTSVGVLAASVDGIYKVRNVFAKKFSKDEETKMKEKEEEIEKITKAVEKDPNAPWNTYEKKQKLQTKPDSGWKAEPKPFRPFKAGLGETEEDEYYSSDYDKDPERRKSKSPRIFKPIYMNYDILLARGPDGMYVFYYSDMDKDELNPWTGIPSPDYDLEMDDLVDYLNDHHSELDKGEGVKGWEGGTAELIKLDDELKNLLMGLYDKDKEFVRALQRLSEVTSASSSGAFTGPMGGGLSKGAISPGYTPAKEINKIINDEDKIYGSKLDEEAVVDETTTAASSGSYVQPAIWAKDEKNWAGNKKTQYPKGQFVTFDPCTKLNNNKKAQQGKCSQGAVDNVVKLRSTKDSVISKNIYEMVAKKTGKTVEDVKNIIEKRIK